MAARLLVAMRRRRMKVPPGFSRLEGLTLIVTNRCNLRCRYCYQDRHDTTDMPWERAKAAVDLLLAASEERRGRDPAGGETVAKIAFYGGEPLLKEGLIRKVVTYVRREAPQGVVPRFSLFTNGLLLGEAVLGFLVEHDFEIQLSSDGVAEAQDDRGKGTFERLDHLFDRFAACDPRLLRDRVRVALTITARNVPHLAASAAYFHRKGVRRLVFDIATGFDPGWTPARLDLLEAQIEAVYRFALRRFLHTGIVFVENFRHDSRDPPPRPGKRECGAGRGTSISVDPYGTVTGCGFFLPYLRRGSTEFLDEQVPGSRGTIDHPETMIPETAYERHVYGNPLWNLKAEKHTPIEACRSCEFVAQCHVCPLSGGYLPGNRDPNLIPIWNCRFTKAILSRKGKFPPADTWLASLASTTA
ncbi:MAG: radical SAM protein [Deltaproteobacteria bacterium]|nr:MAG: radical SAM protein [Deltaproteobacteria bacterium]